MDEHVAVISDEASRRLRTVADFLESTRIRLKRVCSVRLS